LGGEGERKKKSVLKELKGEAHLLLAWEELWALLKKLYTRKLKNR